MPAAFFHQQYELEKDGKKQVWQIWREGDTVTIRTSGTGVRAKQTQKAYPTQRAAIAEATRLVAEKEAAGWRAMLDDKGRPKRKEAARNAKLEEAILADPDDADAYLVYSDWLTEQNDPFGEFITVQAKRSDHPKDKKLLAREETLFKAHGKEWLGELFGAEKPVRKGAKPLLEIEWYCGFMHGVHVREQTFYPDLVKLRVARFIRELGIEFFGDLRREHIVNTLLKHGLPPALHFLGLVGSLDTSNGSVHLEKLFPALADLDALAVVGHRVVLGKKPSLPSLTALTFVSRRLQPEDLDALAAANLPKLEELHIGFGRDGDEPEISLAQLRKALTSKALAKAKKVTFDGPAAWAADLEKLSR